MRRSKLKFAYAFIVVIQLLITTAYAQRSLELARDGKSNFVIALPANPSRLEKDAAGILQKYFYQVTNATLAIVPVTNSEVKPQLVVGKTSNVSKAEISSLGKDGFIIRRINNTVVLTGGERKGALYAVYTFLEDYLGCQAFTSDFIRVPKRNLVLLPANLNRREVPSFFYRMTFFPDAQDFDYCDWRKLTTFYESWGMWVHSFNQLLPPEKYFASHPEYFALRDGRRKPTQPCLTNPDVFAIIERNLRDTIRKNASAQFWSVSQNDNWEHCQCANCKSLDQQQGSPQGSLMTFVNKIASKFPNKTISTLAYQYSEKPPKTIIPGKNVMVMLCTEAYKDRATPIESSKKFDSVYAKWSLLTKELFLWDYLTNFNHFFLPFPNVPVYQANLKYFRSKGARYLFLQGTGIYKAELSELKCYLLSKLMWNTNTNANSVIDTFLVNYYGPKAAPMLRKYIDQAFQNAVKSNNKIVIHGIPNDYFSGYLSASNIKVYKNLFRDALATVDTNSVFYSRILKEYASILYAEIENHKANADASANQNIASLKTYTQLLNDWYNVMKALNLWALNEASRTVDTHFREAREPVDSKKD